MRTEFPAAVPLDFVFICARAFPPERLLHPGPMFLLPVPCKVAPGVPQVKRIAYQKGVVAPQGPRCLSSNCLCRSLVQQATRSCKVFHDTACFGVVHPIRDAAMTFLHKRLVQTLACRFSQALRRALRLFEACCSMDYFCTS